MSNLFDPTPYEITDVTSDVICENSSDFVGNQLYDLNIFAFSEAEIAAGKAGVAKVRAILARERLKRAKNADTANTSITSDIQAA